MKKHLSLKSITPFILKLHLYIGIFIAPFILLASLTGVLYILTPQIESYIYRDLLIVDSNSKVKKSLDEQLAIALSSAKGRGLKLYSIRPSLRESASTRVLFKSDKLRSSEFHTLFINPYELTILGELSTYGTSGVLPLRMKIDYFHRDLMLGDWGRWYSELAASWMWISGLSGFFLFLIKYKKSMAGKLLRRHVFIGLFSLFALIFLSITGLTWSKWAGSTISTIRKSLSWHTPSPKRLTSPTQDLNIAHSLDKVFEISKRNGIDSAFIEIVPPKNNTSAWFIREIERKFPPKVDSITIHPQSFEVLDSAYFKDFNLMAKLTRYGIDFHMGNLFGVFNQILLTLSGCAIIYLIISGYKIYFRRLKAKKLFAPNNNLIEIFKRQPMANKLLIASTIAILCYFLPLLAISLMLILTTEKFYCLRS